MKFMRQFGLGFALTSVLLLSGTTVQAQVRTDNTGPIITDEGGIDPINTDTGGFTNVGVAKVVNRQAQELNRDLARGEVGGVPLSQEGRQYLQQVLEGGKVKPTVIDSVANSITSPGKISGDNARQLVQSLKGVLAPKVNATTLLNARKTLANTVSGRELTPAELKNFSISAEQLKSYAPEVQVIYTIMTTLINSANSAP